MRCIIAITMERISQQRKMHNKKCSLFLEEGKLFYDRGILKPKVFLQRGKISQYDRETYTTAPLINSKQGKSGECTLRKIYTQKHKINTGVECTMCKQNKCTCVADTLLPNIKQSTFGWSAYTTCSRVYIQDSVHSQIMDYHLVQTSLQCNYVHYKKCLTSVHWTCMHYCFNNFSVCPLHPLYYPSVYYRFPLTLVTLKRASCLQALARARAWGPCWGFGLEPSQDLGPTALAWFTCTAYSQNTDQTPLSLCSG